MRPVRIQIQNAVPPNVFLVLMLLLLIVGVTLTLTPPASATLFFFSTGNPDGRMGMGSRHLPSFGSIEIEAADDFILSSATVIDHATFIGLLLGGLPIISSVDVEIYRVFPKDSVNPPDGRVPTRVNSPSDVALVDRSTRDGTLSFVTSILNPSFTVANTVLNGIFPIPNQTTGGEGAATGTEVRFDVTFTTPLDLPPDHYFFVPQVDVTGGNFLWLSAPRPIVSPGTPFSPDLQAWIRNANLDPDWLRVGTDIVGGSGTFNGTFSLSSSVVPEPASMLLIGTGLAGLALVRRRTSAVKGTQRSS